MDNNLSTEFTLKTKEEIQSVVECKKAQEECVDLCSNLDETVRKIRKRFLVYVYCLRNKCYSCKLIEDSLGF